jgi:4-methyl-5(b-hydroxyethyl)-thiazole monophosphate biosynthesis
MNVRESDAGEERNAALRFLQLESSLRPVFVLVERMRVATHIAAFQASPLRSLRSLSVKGGSTTGLSCCSIASARQAEHLSWRANVSTGCALRSQLLGRANPASSSAAPRTAHALRLLATVSAMTTKTALVAVANGSEEIETVTAVDTLVRAGAHVTLASVEKELQVTASRGVKLVADLLISDASLRSKQFDAVVLPGGMPGAEHLRDSQPLMDLVKRHLETGKLIGAICAAPAVALASHHLLNDVKATCYPAPNFRAKLTSHAHIDDPVVRDGQFITSQGPGTAMAFSLALVEALFGHEQAEKVAKAMLVTLPAVSKR